MVMRENVFADERLFMVIIMKMLLIMAMCIVVSVFQSFSV
jgi:hypothetical protein